MSALQPPTADDRRIPEFAVKVCFALAVLHVAVLPVAYLAGMYIYDRNGLGFPTDFVTIWSAGRLALEGQIASIYDWDLHKQAQVAILGQSFEGHFGWHYPPPTCSSSWRSHACPMPSPIRCTPS